MLETEQHCYDDHGSRLTITRYGSNVLLFVASGHLSADHARRMIDTAQELIDRRGRIQAFHDWEGVTTYDEQCKLELTGFVWQNRQHFASAHLLVTNSVVSFAVEVANIVLRNKIVTHADRAGFAAALQRVLNC